MQARPTSLAMSKPKFCFLRFPKNSLLATTRRILVFSLLHSAIVNTSKYWSQVAERKLELIASKQSQSFIQYVGTLSTQSASRILNNASSGFVNSPALYITSNLRSTSLSRHRSRLPPLSMRSRIHFDAGCSVLAIKSLLQQRVFSLWQPISRSDIPWVCRVMACLAESKSSWLVLSWIQHYLSLLLKNVANCLTLTRFCIDRKSTCPPGKNLCRCEASLCLIVLPASVSKAISTNRAGSLFFCLWFKTLASRANLETNLQYSL